MAAGASMLDQKQKQQLLHGPASRAGERRRYAQTCLAQGWLSDALEFFHKAEDLEGMAAVRTRAVEEGDVFLLRQVVRNLESQATEDEWRALAANAKRLGKLEFAREGFRMAGDNKQLGGIDEDIAALKKQLHPQEQEPASAEDAAPSDPQA